MKELDLSELTFWSYGHTHNIRYCITILKHIAKHAYVVRYHTYTAKYTYNTKEESFVVRHILTQHGRELN